jgi:hypothetical protein
MLRKRASVLIVVGLVLPVVLSAGALERYYVPQESTKSAAPQIDQQVYNEFRAKAAGYPPEKREKLKTYYRQKMKQAVRDRNFDAASHYQKLLDILNSF